MANRPLIFLNLSNGVVYPGPFDGLVRIQSTWCEQKHWSRIIEDLDYTFLIPLALGRKCVVVDVSAKKEESRAIYQGLPWIKYVIDTIAFQRYHPLGRPPGASVRGLDCTTYFWDQLKLISDEAEHKLSYVRRVTNHDAYFGMCKLDGLSISQADVDGNTCFIRHRLQELYQTGA